MIARLLPLEPCSWVFGKLWRVFAPLTSRHARALANLELALPDKTRTERQAIARGMWETLGRIFGEFFHLEEIGRGDRIDVSDIALQLANIDAFKGAIVCACHQGNWEIGVLGPNRLGVPSAGIYQRIANPLVDRKVLELRAKHYPGGLLEKSPLAGTQALRMVRQGGCLAFLADLRDNDGLAVPFFGRPAPSTPFPAYAARLLNVPLYALVIARQPRVRFKLGVEQIEVPRTDDRKADVLAATTALQAAFERSIRDRPEQWMWAHRRWG